MKSAMKGKLEVEAVPQTKEVLSVDLQSKPSAIYWHSTATFDLIMVPVTFGADLHCRCDEQDVMSTFFNFVWQL